MVQQSRYYFGIATVTGPVCMADDPMRVGRITMFSRVGKAMLRHKTSRWYLRYCRFKGKDSANETGNSNPLL